MTACVGTGWSAACAWNSHCGVIDGTWGFLCLHNSNWHYLTWVCCVVVTMSWSTCIGQCTGLSLCRCSTVVPGLGTDVGVGNSHIGCSRVKWIGPQHEWMMLRRLLQ